ncbi:hypothetical protein PspLS_07008 [Pyricularia sp. CBS 133598]|nr:hypothetical protein PspLS_07008 [Pyricularia sp. CBS 133598]
MKLGNFLFFYSFCKTLALPSPVPNHPNVQRGRVVAAADLARAAHDYQSCVHIVVALGQAPILMVRLEREKQFMRAVLLLSAHEGCREKFPGTAPLTLNMQYPDPNIILPAMISKPTDFESCVSTSVVLMNSSKHLFPLDYREQYKEQMVQVIRAVCGQAFPESPNRALPSPMSG